MKNIDWTGNRNSIFKTLGASNHTDKEREVNDFYATDPIAIDKLLCKYQLPHRVWEPSCGQGHLSERLRSLGYEVLSSDLIDRGYGTGGVDFLISPMLREVECILTNPPYCKATEFIQHALDILPGNGVCAMFLKTTFLEGKGRYEKLFSVTPPKYIFQFSERILCAKNGEFSYMKAHGGSAVAYAWFIREKGWTGNTIIDWI